VGGDEANVLLRALACAFSVCGSCPPTIAGRITVVPKFRIVDSPPEIRHQIPASRFGNLNRITRAHKFLISLTARSYIKPMFRKHKWHKPPTSWSLNFKISRVGPVNYDKNSKILNLMLLKFKLLVRTSIRYHSRLMRNAQAVFIGRKRNQFTRVRTALTASRLVRASTSLRIR
jgi:hypothetical protein